MRESEIEDYFTWEVSRMRGVTYKLKFIGRKGAPDRIALLPWGDTWFVELKTPAGKLSELQKSFARNVIKLKQCYAVINSIEGCKQWANLVSDRTNETPRAFWSTILDQ